MSTCTPKDVEMLQPTGPAPRRRDECLAQDSSASSDHRCCSSMPGWMRGDAGTWPQLDLAILPSFRVPRPCVHRWPAACAGPTWLSTSRSLQYCSAARSRGAAWCCSVLLRGRQEEASARQRQPTQRSSCLVSSRADGCCKCGCERFA